MLTLLCGILISNLPKDELVRGIRVSFTFFPCPTKGMLASKIESKIHKSSIGMPLSQAKESIPLD